MREDGAPGGDPVEDRGGGPVVGPAHHGRDPAAHGAPSGVALDHGFPLAAVGTFVGFGRGLGVGLGVALGAGLGVALDPVPAAWLDAFGFAAALSARASPAVDVPALSGGGAAISRTSAMANEGNTSTSDPHGAEPHDEAVEAAEPGAA